MLSRVLDHQAEIEVMRSADTPPCTIHAAHETSFPTVCEGIDEGLLMRIEQLEAVCMVTAEITRELELTSLLALIIQRAVELIDAAVSGAVFLWDEVEQVLIPQAWHGYGEWMRGVRLKPGEAIAGAVFQSRKGLLVNHYQTSPYAHPIFRACRRIQLEVIQTSYPSLPILFSFRVGSDLGRFPHFLLGQFHHIPHEFVHRLGIFILRLP